MRGEEYKETFYLLVQNTGRAAAQKIQLYQWKMWLLVIYLKEMLYEKKS
jgi:hypothetical protein